MRNMKKPYTTIDLLQACLFTNNYLVGRPSLQIFPTNVGKPSVFRSCTYLVQPRYVCTEIQPGPKKRCLPETGNLPLPPSSSFPPSHLFSWDFISETGIIPTKRRICVGRRRRRSLYACKYLSRRRGRRLAVGGGVSWTLPALFPRSTPPPPTER